jgi:hypothetical protein
MERARVLHAAVLSGKPLKKRVYMFRDSISPSGQVPPPGSVLGTVRQKMWLTKFISMLAFFAAEVGRQSA